MNAGRRPRVSHQRHEENDHDRVEDQGVAGTGRHFAPDHFRRGLGVVRDTSQYAFSPALGYASGIMALCTFFFCMIVAFIFWVATMGDKAKVATTSPSKGELPHGMPAMAGASSALGKPGERKF